MNKIIKDLYTTKYLYVCLNNEDFENKLKQLNDEEYKMFIFSSTSVLYREYNFIYEMYYKANSVLCEISRRTTDREMNVDERMVSIEFREILKQKEVIIADYKAQYESVVKKQQYPVVAPKDYDYKEMVEKNYYNVFKMYYGQHDFDNSVIATINEFIYLYKNRTEDYSINEFGYIAGKEENNQVDLYSRIAFDLNKKKLLKQINKIRTKEEEKVIKKKK